MLDTNIPFLPPGPKPWDQEEPNSEDYCVECACCGGKLLVGDLAYKADYSEWYCSLECAAEFEWAERDLEQTTVDFEDAEWWDAV